MDDENDLHLCCEERARSGEDRSGSRRPGPAWARPRRRKKRRENLNFENLNFGANFDGEPDDDARNFEEMEASTVRTSRCPCMRSENEKKIMLNL